MDKYWKKIERRWAKKLGGKRVWLSRNPEGPEDVVCEDLVMDVKSTRGKDHITIKRKDLEEIVERGKKLGKIGCLGFQFYKSRKQYVILPFEEFERLRKLEKEVR